MKTVLLKGRKLQIVTAANIEHDYWLTKQIRDAGIDQIDINPEGNADEEVKKVIDRVIGSGSAMVLLGGLLAPVEMDPEDWTPAVAEDMTKFLNRMAATEDKVVVRGLVAEAILGFFYTGLVSVRISRMSSTIGREPGEGGTHESPAAIAEA